MLTESGALAMVEVELSKLSALPDGDAWVVLRQHTIERPFGWVFFYGSRLFAETGDARYAVVGNAPLLVNRFSGVLQYTGTAQPVANYIAEYEAQLAAGGA